MKMQLNDSKTPFIPSNEHKDLSGMDLIGLSFSPPVSLDHGFFNGTNIKNCVFDTFDVSHCEFAEAYLHKTAFKSVDFSGSDLVGARFEDVVFEDCDFTSGEWRETQFTRVIFIRCVFKHTTINLCTFISCSFCAKSTEWLDHIAVNYNVFSHTEFDSCAQNTTVLSKNFGLPASPAISAMIPAHAGLSLEEVCLARAIGMINIPALINAIESELVSTAKGRMKRLRLEFISNIITSLAREKSISASSMIYAEKVFQELAQTVADENDFSTVMSAIINIRNALFQNGVETADAWKEHELSYCSHIQIHYDRNFSRDDATELAENLAYVAQHDPTTLQVADVRTGSTIIEIAVSAAFTASSLLIATNFLLRQATVTVQRVNTFKKEWAKLCKPPAIKTRTLKTNQADKLPAIMKSGSVLPELQPVKELVEKEGKKVVRFDEKADVVIQVQPTPVKRRKVKAGSGANTRRSVVG